jgi:hypothetical protein
MQNHKARIALLSAASLAGAALSLPARGTLLYAAGTNPTSNTSFISRFDDASLGVVTTVPITGLQAGETIVDIDVRPKPTSPGVNSLYGVGSSSRLYIINPLTGTSTQVGSAGAFTLNGTAFGVDFNPTVDRMRVVSNTEQSFRLNPDTGVLAGADTSLNPAGNIVSVAYDRNFDQSGVPTTLFGIDSIAGTLVRIGGLDGVPSPNLGEVTTIGSLGLGIALNDTIGFDILSSAAGSTAYAAINTGGFSRLYTVDLATGHATLASSNGGSIGTGATPYVGLASSVVPEPSAIGAGLGAGLMLIRRRRAQR